MALLYEILKAYPGSPAIGERISIEKEDDAKPFIEKGYLKSIDDGTVNKLISEQIKGEAKGIADELSKHMSTQFGELRKSISEMPKVSFPAGADSPELINPSHSYVSRTNWFGERCLLNKAALTYAEPRVKRSKMQSMGEMAWHLRRIHGSPGYAANESSEYLSKSYAEYFGETTENVNKLMSAPEGQRLEWIRKAPTGMGELIMADGGYLVPQDISYSIIERMFISNPILQMIDLQQISGATMTYTLNAESSRANGSRFGGINSYWAAEAASFTASQPTFRQIKLEPHKLTALVYFTEELWDDAFVAIDQHVSRYCSEDMNFRLNDAILNGTGAGMPQGILNSPSLVTVSKETGQAAATIVTENIWKMWARMDARSRMNSVWVYNQNCEPQLFSMTLGIGTAGVVTFMPPGGISGAPFATLMGRPMIPIEWSASVGTVGDLMLIDFTQYKACTRGGLKSAMSIHVGFLTEQNVMRFSIRFDGQGLWHAPITPFKGTSDTQSWAVALATRS